MHGACCDLKSHVCWDKGLHLNPAKPGAKPAPALTAVPNQHLNPISTAANAGRRVLEIGCGPGLVATCVCRSGAGRVLLTDGDPQALVNCLSNLRMNRQGGGTLLGCWQEAAGFVQGAAVVEGASCQPAQVGLAAKKSEVTCTLARFPVPWQQHGR